MKRTLNTKGLILLIATMNMVVPLSIDMYLPAVPQMTDYFSTSAPVVNLTLVGFFFFLAIGILIFGPLSDKHGRKPLLLFGTGVYLLGSVACALAVSIEQLIAFRIAEALGAGCMVAVSTAMIKDAFSGKTRDNVLAVVQAMGVVAPMLAPLIGAFILTFATWRMTFWVLTGIALLCFMATCFMLETLNPAEQYHGTLTGSIGRLLVVGRNKGFTSFMLIVAVISAPYMAYIAVSSYIYIAFFQLSAAQYSYFFAINSAASLIGPVVYIAANGRINPRVITWLCFGVAFVSGGFMLLFGTTAPILFLLSFLPFTIIESALRPFSTAILLDQQEGDTGSASALINFIHIAFGSLGMVLGALHWPNYIFGLGIILMTGAAISTAGWVWILWRKIKVKGLTV